MAVQLNACHLLWLKRFFAKTQPTWVEFMLITFQQTLLMVPQFQTGAERATAMDHTATFV